MRVDTLARMHNDANVRTTIDIPEELYRVLKARAALRGITLRELIQGLLEQGLNQPTSPTARREAPPVLVPARGVPIRALSAEELRRLDDSDDERNARSS